MKTITLILMIICVAACRSNENHRNAVSSSIPSVNLLSLDSVTILNTRQIPFNSMLVLVYFSPDCDHCNREIRSIVDHIGYLPSVRFVLMTPASVPELKAFYNEKHLQQYPNITVAVDYRYNFYNQFTVRQFPFTVIYNKDRELIKLYNQEIGYENIVPLLGTNNPQ